MLIWIVRTVEKVSSTEGARGLEQSDRQRGSSMPTGGIATDGRPDNRVKWQRLRCHGSVTVTRG